MYLAAQNRQPNEGEDSNMMMSTNVNMPVTEPIVVIQPDAVLMFEVEVTLQGPAQILQFNETTVRNWLTNNYDDVLPGMPYCSLVEVVRIQHTPTQQIYSLLFATAKAPQKAAGETLTNDEIRRKLRERLRVGWFTGLNWQALEQHGIRITVGEVLRLPVASANRMQRLMGAARHYSMLDGAPPCVVVPATGTKSTLRHFGRTLGPIYRHNCHQQQVAMSS